MLHFGFGLHILQHVLNERYVVCTRFILSEKYATPERYVLYNVCSWILSRSEYITEK